MLKRLLRKLKNLFSPARPAQDLPGRSQPTAQYGDMVGNVKIEKPYQLDKHTAFKPGESYRVGEMIVTVHASKESMLSAIAAVDARRAAKEARLTEKAINIMLMTPEQLQELKVEEFLNANRAKDSLFKRIMGKFWNKGRTNHFVKLEAKHASIPNTPNPNSIDITIKQKVVEKV
jgi:hypothetical protein